nr:non-canonical non-ribosomal peptide synthetase fub8 [Quercus suber]
MCRVHVADTIGGLSEGIQSPGPVPCSRLNMAPRPDPVTHRPSRGWRLESSEEQTPDLCQASLVRFHSPLAFEMVPAVSIPYGRRLIPQILDDVVSTDPERIIYTLTSFPHNSPSFRHITARAFAKAVDKTAWWLQSLLGTSTSIRPLAYIGPPGCTALFLSPMNNTEAAIAVLQASDCSLWIHPSEQQKKLPLVSNVLERRPMKILHLPPLDELLGAEPVEPYQYEKTFEKAAKEPFCMLHTSGTTGVPKPISWTHALIGTMDAVRLLPPVEGDEGLAPWTSIWRPGDTLYSSFPMSHGAGIIMDILMPSLFDLRCVLGPAGVLPNMNLVEALVEHAGIDIWSMVPSLVDELGETPDVLAKFTSAKFICASGGPVSPEIGAKVNDVVRVLNLTGTSEGLFIGNLIVQRKDWLWFAFHPYSGFEFKEIEDDAYEHWVHRNDHAELFQGIFHTFPDKDSINLKDLYVRHPTKSNLWAFKGRSDDVVVLSNGYKISPLSTEAYISTHPDINGCLVIGTGRSQAGLLVELKEDAASKSTELFDSVWATVEKSNELSVTKNRLLRDYVAFADPEKPFIRTDKGTVKRHATLLLYSDFIERFYSSRGDDSGGVEIDTTSDDTILESLRQIFASSLPAIANATPDTDVFDLGLDSLFVFRAINIIRASIGLKDKLAPRHLYANPTLDKFAAFLARLVSEEKQLNSKGPQATVDDETTKLRITIAQHRARQGFKLNPFDYVNANHYMGLNLYFSLNSTTSFDEAFAKLQAGLRRMLELIPAMDGKIMFSSEQEIGHKKGDLRITIPPLSLHDPKVPPRQLVFKDQSKFLSSYAQLKECGFLPSSTRDWDLLPCDPFPTFPADLIVGQANFIEGGCILAVNFHHGCLDAVGVMVALKVWAESCRYFDGDKTATCSWLDPECFNHSLPEILHELEGYSRPASEVDFGVWAFLPFLRSAQPGRLKGFPPEGDNTHSTRNGNMETTPKTGRSSKALPEPPTWHHVRTTVFLLPKESIATLKSEVTSDPETKGTITSISDIIQAFFWRVAIRARFHVATKVHNKKVSPDEQAILELPIDGRPYLSSLLPSTYMGSLLVMNRPQIAVHELVSPSTSIARVALLLREAAARVTPSLLSDAFNILKEIPTYDPAEQFSLADMGLDGFHAMISNMILFQPGEISFGDAFFGNGGSPESLRPQIERGANRFRFLVIYPMRKDGGVELALGTLPEELEMLKEDGEFMKYARLMD